jgi:ATP-binding cassette subfamily B protein
MRISRLFPYLIHHRAALTVGVVAIVLGDILLLFGPWLLKTSIDALQAGDTAGAREAAVLMLVVTAGGGFFKFIMRRWMIGASRKIEQELRHDFTAHIFTLSPRYYDTHRVGEMMALATNDINAIRMLLGPGIMYLVNTIFTATVALILMSSLSVKLTIIAFLPLPILGLAVQQGSRLIYGRFALVQEEFAGLTSFAQEALSGIRPVKAYAREDILAARFDGQSDEYLQKNLSYFGVQAFLRPVMMFLAGFATALTLYFGGRMVIADAISVGTLVAFMAYLAQLTWPAMALGFTINIWQRGLASLDRLGRVLDAEPEIVDAASPHPWTDPVGHVRVKELSFTYPTAEKSSLQEVSFELEPGSWTALVGETGSGKTTLVRLLSRQYDEYSGLIQLDGEDLRRIRLADLRSALGYAPQDGFLFSDTLQENILFARPDGGEEEVERLARISRLERDKDAFPEGWQTMVGERGVTLSGGQKQRVSIARALASDPKLLLLDDVFSSVDNETEAELLAQLREAWQGSTVLLVTHRLLGVQEADQILVMDRGRLVESGDHESLMQEGGVYAGLFRQQATEAELDAMQ